MSKIGDIFYETPFFTDRELNSIVGHSALTKTGIQTVSSYQCVCEHSYGKHTFSIMTFHYNDSSNKPYISEIKLPYTFFVLPRGLTHFAANKYKELQNDVRKAINEGKMIGGILGDILSMIYVMNISFLTKCKKSF